MNDSSNSLAVAITAPNVGRCTPEQPTTETASQDAELRSAIVAQARQRLR